MILSQNEAVCLILELSKNKEISSPTKLNKLLARLNLHFIPIDIYFSLNKYGSFRADLSDLKENDYFRISQYQYHEKPVNKFLLKDEGEKLFERVIKPKLNKILTKYDFESLRTEIYTLSSLNVGQISDNEHKKLLVDVDERFKLEQRANEIYVEMEDIYKKIGDMPENTIDEIRLKALIEYCFYLSKYLKDKRIGHLPERYDFEGYMFDYYFLYNILEIIPFLKKQISEETKEGIRINRYYQYFVNSVKKENYPFSFQNKDLKDLIAG